MNKARIARIARLVALRQQQRRIQEAVHATAQQRLELATKHRECCEEDYEALARQHDDSLAEELEAADLELMGCARTHAGSRLKEASEAKERANEEAEKTREGLLDAHRAHRSLEMYHGRIQTLYFKDLARTEQKDLDELASRAVNARRMW